MEQEMAVLASLARIDPAQLTFGSISAATADKTDSQQKAGQISLVVAEGLQVELPLAGW